MAELLRQDLIHEITDRLIDEHSGLYLDSLASGRLGKMAKAQIRGYLKKSYAKVINTEERLDYAMREICGFGVLDEISQNPQITDVDYDAPTFRVKDYQGYHLYDGHVRVDENYMIRLAQKFAYATRHEFSEKNPVLNVVYGIYRINAQHHSVSPYGTTFHARISRPTLILNDSNAAASAPLYMFDFLKVAMRSRFNTIIFGEGGAGKTTLQKYLLGFINPNDKIDVMEDSPDSHVKEVYPKMNISSWISTGSQSLEQLVTRSGLRNDAKWVSVAETLGAEAAAEYLALTSGHKVITTMHVDTAEKVVTRFIAMMKMGMTVDEASATADLAYFLNIGIHAVEDEWRGTSYRYIEGIYEFRDTGRPIPLFRQYMDNEGVFHRVCRPYSDDLQVKIDRMHLNYHCDYMKAWKEAEPDGEETVLHH